MSETTRIEFGVYLQGEPTQAIAEALSSVEGPADVWLMHGRVYELEAAPS